MRIPKITLIDVNDEEVTFHFEGSLEPWNAREFVHGTNTHEQLAAIEEAILKFNKTATGYISAKSLERIADQNSTPKRSRG